MSNSNFLAHWLGQPVDAYLAAHNNQVPSHNEMCAEFTARKLPRGEMIVLVAGTVREALIDWADAQTTAPQYAPTRAASPTTSQADWTAMCARLWEHPRRKQIEAIIRLLLADTDAAL